MCYTFAPFLYKEMKKHIAFLATLVLLFALGLNAIQPIFSFSKNLKSHISYTLEEIGQVETANIGESISEFTAQYFLVLFQSNFQSATNTGTDYSPDSRDVLPFADTPRYIYFQNLKLYC